MGTYGISWSLHRYGMSTVENERKIRVLLRKNYCVKSIRGGLKSEKLNFIFFVRKIQKLIARIIVRMRKGGNEVVRRGKKWLF